MPHEYDQETCYWLPPLAQHVTAGQWAILEALSALAWVDAPAATWRDGELIEHAPPRGLTAGEVVAVLRGEEPTPRQIREMTLKAEELIKRKLIERTDADRYRLRGWECLHTKRRRTRLLIEHGGGRARFACVRFSA